MDEESPITSAIRQKSLNTARALAQVTPDFDVNNAQQNYLHVACEGNDLEMASFLIELGIGINNVDSHGLTALHYAVKKDCYDFAHLLLASGAICDRKMQELAKPKLKPLIDRYQQERREDETLLHLAVRCNDEEHLSLLFKRESLKALNKEGEAALHLAIKMDRLAIARKLLSYQRDLIEQVDGSGRMALFLAAARPYNSLTFELFQFVYKYIPIQHIEHPSEAMLTAISTQDLVLFYQCVSYGHPLVNSHFSLLHIATSSGSVQIAQHLVLWFASDVNIRDKNWETPMTVALRTGQRQLASFFILQGADVDPLLKIQIEALAQFERDMLKKIVAFDLGWKKQLDQLATEKGISNNLFQAWMQQPTPLFSPLWDLKAITKNRVNL